MDGTLLYGPTLTTEADAVVAPQNGVGTFCCYTLAASPIAFASPSTSSVPVLYNPPTSNVVLRIMKVVWGWVAGSVVVGSLGYGYQQNAVLSALTAGPNPIGSYIGGRVNAFQGFWYTTATWGTAPVFIASGVNTIGAAAAGSPCILREEINGFIALAPGSAFAPLVSNGAMAMTATCRVDVLQTLIPTGG